MHVCGERRIIAAAIATTATDARERQKQMDPLEQQSQTAADEKQPASAEEVSRAHDHAFFTWFVVISLVIALIPIGMAIAARTGFLGSGVPLASIAQHALMHPSSAGRDAGGFAGDYDYGGGYDWGGSDYDYDWGGSSYDWDDYDYSYDYGSGYDYDYGSGYSSGYGYSYSSSTNELEDFVITMIIILVIVHQIRKSNGSNSRPAPRTTRTRPQGAEATRPSNLRQLSTLKKRDPAFDETAVETFIANIYVQMQHAWTAGDFSPMRPYFSNALYAQFASQLGALRAKGHTNHVDNIAVLESEVRGWYESEGREHLVLRLRTRIVDYTVNDSSGVVISGSKNAEKFMEYEYTLTRTSGTQTYVQDAQVTTVNCPNCGAAVDIAQSAKCPFCDSVLESKTFTWVISAIKGISQRTVR